MLQALEIINFVKNYDNIIIAAHGSPDGDAIGSSCAMSLILEHLKKRYCLFNSTGIPSYLSWVKLPQPVITVIEDLPFKPGLIIALDSGDAQRLGVSLNKIFAKIPSINIDHHLSNPNFGSVYNWVDSQMAATGQMVAQIAQAAEMPLVGELARHIYLALISDTGSFSHSNTTPEVFLLAAKLVANGLDASSLREEMDNNWSQAKVKLWGKLLQEVKVLENGQIALSSVRLGEIQGLGAVREDLEGFVEQMRRISGVRVAIMLREDNPKRCKLSLRSHGQDDVRTIATNFGGGGHLNAAGATIDLDLATLEKQAIKAVAAIL